MPDVTSTGFTTKNRIFTPFWYQKCKNYKVVLPIRIWIWLKHSRNLPMWNVLKYTNGISCKLGVLRILCSNGHQSQTIVAIECDNVTPACTFLYNQYISLLFSAKKYTWWSLLKMLLSWMNLDFNKNIEYTHLIYISLCRVSWSLP